MKEWIGVSAEISNWLEVDKQVDKWQGPERCIVRGLLFGRRLLLNYNNYLSLYELKYERFVMWTTACFPLAVKSS